MANCFDGLVGITRKTDCPCYESEITDEYKTSKFNLFLDEHNGGITLDSIRAVQECGGTLLDYFKNSIEQAKEFFKADLQADLTLRYKTAVDPFTGYAGSRSFARTRLLGTAGWAGVRLSVDPKIGAYFTLSRINMYLDTTDADITVRIIKRKQIPGGSDYEETLVKEITGIQSTAGQEKENVLADADITVLPLFDLEAEEFEYFILWDRSTAADANPKDNANRCNCGRSEMRMLQYFNPAGVQGDINALGDMTVSNTVNGIVIYGEAKCGTDDVLCDALEINETMNKVASFAIWFKAGAILMDKILGSPEVSKYTMANREYNYGRRNHWEKEYFSRIRFIGENINLSGTDCLQCDEDKGLSLGGILA